MDSFDSNIIKPIDGLQSISGMAPTRRREQRRQNMDSGKKEDQSKLHDEEINISDIVYLIDYYFNKGPAPYMQITSDFNCDGLTGIIDIVFLNSHIFSNGDIDCCP